MWWSSFWAHHHLENLVWGYFWPSIFKDGIFTVEKCHPYHIFYCKIPTHPPLLQLAIYTGPFV